MFREKREIRDRVSRCCAHASGERSVTAMIPLYVEDVSLDGSVTVGIIRSTHISAIAISICLYTEETDELFR